MRAIIQLPDGSPYWPLEPERAIPSIYNIAHKLSQTNRFGGSCLFPYSVAQHLYTGAKAILRDGYDKKVAMAYLFHDAPEPLGFCDLPAPIKYGDDQTEDVKNFVRLHRKFEQRILDSLLAHYGVSTEKCVWDIVGAYDTRIIADEKMQVMAPEQFEWGTLPEPLDIDIKPVTWQQAMMEWMRLYHMLKWD